ncbi:MAG: hypothetical protein KDC57_19395 [Saprospiraceae bacterium]|nr:hypothetical protein [Saprospiraceae bacterium]
MIHLLRNIRRQQIDTGRVRKYLFYALGEIILVVIGILIALEVNNRNDAHQTRAKELVYLQKLKADLENSNQKMDQFILKQKQYVTAAQEIIDHIEGKPILDWQVFNEQCISIYDWRRFYLDNYTFQDLIYSGNLNLISNDTIKTLLLQLDGLYQQYKAKEEHFRFDSETIIFTPSYNLLDLHPTFKKHIGQDVVLSEDMYRDYFRDKRTKNGFLMAIIEFSTMNGMLNQMKTLTETMLGCIDRELAR